MNNYIHTDVRISLYILASNSLQIITLGILGPTVFIFGHKSCCSMFHVTESVPVILFMLEDCLLGRDTT
jgi:hypothetical protein